MTFVKAITPLLWRVIAFLGIFLLVTGLVGPRVISGGILFRDGFGLYGGIGKAAIFGIVAFVLLARHYKKQVVLLPWQAGQWWWLIAAGVLFAVAGVAIDNLLIGLRTPVNLAWAHGGLLVGLLLAAIGCFGLKNSALLWRHYKRQLLASVAIAAAFYVFLLAVYALWQPLASVVLVAVKSLLGISGLQATVFAPHTLIFDKFGITIAEYCSGIESIALFTGLYAVVGLLDWPRLNKRRYVVIFPLALTVLFLLNIVRVYALIMAGYHINPQIAFSLFHTYAGLVFFICYSAVFWAVAYRYLFNSAKRS